MLLDIQREHLEEAEFLWARRRVEMRSPLLDLRRLAELEERLDAHLDGLAAGVQDGWSGPEEALTGGEHDAAAAAAAAMAAAGHGRALVGKLSALEPAAIRAIADALCYADLYPDTVGALRELISKETSPSSALATALEILSFHRVLEPASLAAFARTQDPALVAVVLRATGRIGGDMALLGAAARHDSGIVRDAALAAMVRKGAPDALNTCRKAVADPARTTPTACMLLGATGDASDVQLLDAACRHEALGEAPVAALASLGQFTGVEAVLGLMEVPRLACVAGAAFTRITGLAPVALAETPTTPETEDLTFDELRPRPDPVATRALWRQHADRFDHRSRWRSGQRLDPNAWRRDAHHGDLATRREELLRVWSTDPARHPALELDAPVRRQLTATSGGTP